MKKYPFMEKSSEELAKEMDKALTNEKEMTPEEVKEDDAEHGYFDGEDD